MPFSRRFLTFANGSRRRTLRPVLNDMCTLPLSVMVHVAPYFAAMHSPRNAPIRLKSFSLMAGVVEGVTVRSIVIERGDRGIRQRPRLPLRGA